MSSVSGAGNADRRNETVKVKLSLLTVLMLLLASGVVNAEVFLYSDLALRPGTTEVWVSGAEPGVLRVYDRFTLNLVTSYDVDGFSNRLAFDAAGDFLYVLANEPEERKGFARCYDADDGELVSESALMGDTREVIVHSNGVIYATCRHSTEGGYVQRFAPVTLAPGVYARSGNLPMALSECPLDGSIMVGDYRGQGGEAPDPECYSVIRCHDPTDLSVIREYHAGLQHLALLPIDDLLVIDNNGVVVVDPGYEYVIKGLTVFDMTSDQITFEWSTLPDIVRGSCFEPASGKWFGFTFHPHSKDESVGRLWMICDMSRPSPVLVGEFGSARVIRMVAFPLDSDTVRVVGVNTQSEDLFVYDAPENAPPESAFMPVPPAGQAPLTVDFLNYSSDCDGNIVEIQADWNGDGITDETFQGSPGTIEHEFVDPGIYEVKVTVVDDDGATDDWEASIPVIE